MLGHQTMQQQLQRSELQTHTHSGAKNSQPVGQQLGSLTMGHIWLYQADVIENNSVKK